MNQIGGSSINVVSIKSLQNSRTKLLLGNGNREPFILNCVLTIPFNAIFSRAHKTRENKTPPHDEYDIDPLCVTENLL